MPQTNKQNKAKGMDERRGPEIAAAILTTIKNLSDVSFPHVSTHRSRHVLFSSRSLQIIYSVTFSKSIASLTVSQSFMPF